MVLTVLIPLALIICAVLQQEMALTALSDENRTKPGVGRRKQESRERRKGKESGL